MSRPASRALLICGLVVLPTFVLWPFRAAWFVSDDVFFGPGFHMDSWQEIWFGAWPHSMGQSKAWRPIVVLTYLAASAWSDGGPVSYHIFNYVLHGINAALLAILVWQLTRERVAAMVAGVLFAMHPILHENVQWISGRTFPIAAFFILMLCVWSVDAPRRRAWLQHAVGVAMLVAALASYEFSIVAPIAAVGIAYLAWGRLHPHPRESWRALARFALPYFAIVALYFCFRWLWLTSLEADVVLAARASTWAPIGSVAYRLPRNVMFAGLRLLAWPWFERGSDIRLGLTGTIPTIVVVWAMAMITTTTTTTDARLRAVGLAAILWAAIFFAPVSAAVAFSDRFGYMSAAGIAALIGTANAIALGERHRAIRRALFPAAVAIVAMMWAVDLRAHGHEWAEAGRIATSLIDQLRQQEPPPEQPVALHFLDVPIRHHSALLFFTYFPLSVTRAFPEPQRGNATVHVESDPEETVLHRLRDEPHERAQHVRLYRWEPSSEKLELRWKQD